MSFLAGFLERSLLHRRDRATHDLTEQGLGSLSILQALRQGGGNPSPRLRRLLLLWRPLSGSPPLCRDLAAVRRSDPHA
jgi:hypothetical protein